jgi:hypothetical protein
VIAAIVGSLICLQDIKISIRWYTDTRDENFEYAVKVDIVLQALLQNPVCNIQLQHIPAQLRLGDDASSGRLAP